MTVKSEFNNKASPLELLRSSDENHFRSGNEREIALTMVIIVDAEISILQLMQRLETFGALVCTKTRARVKSVCVCVCICVHT